jgi:hypothetical protein
MLILEDEQESLTSLSPKDRKTILPTPFNPSNKPKQLPSNESDVNQIDEKTNGETNSATQTDGIVKNGEEKHQKEGQLSPEKKDGESKDSTVSEHEQHEGEDKLLKSGLDDSKAIEKSQSVDSQTQTEEPLNDKDNEGNLTKSQTESPVRENDPESNSPIDSSTQTIESPNSAKISNKLTNGGNSTPAENNNDRKEEPFENSMKDLFDVPPSKKSNPGTTSKDSEHQTIESPLKEPSDKTDHEDKEEASPLKNTVNDTINASTQTVNEDEPENDEGETNAKSKATQTEEIPENESTLQEGNRPLDTTHINDTPIIPKTKPQKTRDAGSNTPAIVSGESGDTSEVELEDPTKDNTPKKTVDASKTTQTTPTENLDEDGVNTRFNGQPSNMIRNESDDTNDPEDETKEVDSPLKKSVSTQTSPNSTELPTDPVKQNEPKDIQKESSENKTPNDPNSPKEDQIDNKNAPNNPTLQSNQPVEEIDTNNLSDEKKPVDATTENKQTNQEGNLPGHDSKQNSANSLLGSEKIPKDDAEDEEHAETYDMSTKDVENLINMAKDPEKSEEIEELIESGMLGKRRDQGSQNVQAKNPKETLQPGQSASSGHPLVMTRVKHNGHPHPKDPSKEKNHPLIVSTATRHKHFYDPNLPMPIEGESANRKKVTDAGSDDNVPSGAINQGSHPLRTHAIKTGKQFVPYGKDKDSSNLKPGLLGTPGSVPIIKPPYSTLGQGPVVQVITSLPQTQTPRVYKQPVITSINGQLPALTPVKVSKSKTLAESNEQLKASLKSQDQAKLAEMSKRIKEAHENAESKHKEAIASKSEAENKKAGLLTKSDGENSQSKAPVEYAKNPFDTCSSFISTSAIIGFATLLLSL